MDEGRLFRQVAENERLLHKVSDEAEVEFFCACGRADCDATLRLTQSEYEAALAPPHRFVVAPGHENPGVDQIVEQHHAYLVVERDPSYAARGGHRRLRERTGRAANPAPPESPRGVEAELAELRVRCTQLEHALQSRVVIEQAKGILAERYGIGVESAFDGLRRAARDERRNLHEIAAAVVASGQTPPGVAARIREAQSR